MTRGCLNEIRLIRCFVGSESYCLRMSEVLSLERSDRLQRNPTRGEPLGWLLADTGDVPVFGLAEMLGRPHSTTRGPIVVLHAGWALMVDRVSRVLAVRPEDLLPIPALSGPRARTIFQGFVPLGADLVLLLAPDRLRPDQLPDETWATAVPAHDLTEPAPVVAWSTAGHPGQLMTFTLPDQGNEPGLRLGLSVSQVPAVTTPLPCIHLPAAPPWLLGISAWRGRPLPVVDLALALGLGATSWGAPSRLLIVRGARRAEILGFPVAPAVQLEQLPLPVRTLTAVLPVDPALVCAAFEVHGTPLLIPDVDRILSNG